MYKLFLIFLIICGSLNFAQQKSADSTGTIKANFYNLSNDKGHLLVALYNSKENYDSGKRFKSAKITISKKETVCVFDSLKFGEYMIATFHDEDDNGKLNTGLFGIPTEDYGYSNNARGSFGPAKFEDAKFQLKIKELTIKIKID